MNRLLVRLKTNGAKIGRNAVKVLKNSDGDQITGWLIVILLVVVVGAVMVVNAAYFNASERKIQLQDSFDVICSTSYRFDVFTPLGMEPVGFDIPMNVRLTGMSEEFWK